MPLSEICADLFIEFNPNITWHKCVYAHFCKNSCRKIIKAQQYLSSLHWIILLSNCLFSYNGVY